MRLKLLGIFLTALLAVLGVWVGSQLAGSHSEQTALGRVESQARINFRDPGVDVFVPLANWGIRFHTWKLPFQIALEPRSLDRGALPRLAAGDKDLLRAARAEVQGAALAAARRSVIGGLLGALAGVMLAALCMFALRAPWAWKVIPIGAGLVVASTIIVALAGVKAFDSESLSSPDYYASGEELPRLLAIGERLDGQVDAISDQAEQTISSVAALLSSRGAWKPGSSSALQVSDLHNSTSALRVLRPLARRQPVFWVGDFSTGGIALEAPMLSDVAKLGRPAVGVSGNHDSEALMIALARSGMVVLTHEGVLQKSGYVSGSPVIKVGDLKVAGFEDPLAPKGRKYPAPRTRFSFTDYPDGDERALRAERRMFKWWKALPSRPDVLLVHQSGLARGLARRIARSGYTKPLTILTGHTHRQRIEISGNTVLIDDGTVGAGGILNLEPEAGLARLHFDGRRLQSVDMISLDMKSGEAQASRILPSRPRCDKKLVLCGRQALYSELKSEGR